MTKAQELENLAKQLLDAAHYCTQLEKLEDHCREVARKLQSLAEDGEQEAPPRPGMKDTVVSVLAEFFQDSFKEDPAGVGDWLDRNGTSADLFVEMVAELRAPQDEGNAQ
jgi:hypothetical protein